MDFGSSDHFQKKRAGTRALHARQPPRFGAKALPSNGGCCRHPTDTHVIRTCPATKQSKLPADEDGPDAFSRGTVELEANHGDEDQPDHLQRVEDFPPHRPALLGSVEDMEAKWQQRSHEQSRHGGLSGLCWSER